MDDVRAPGNPPPAPFTRKIRVLIVDDSAIVRKVLKDTLSREPDIEVVGTAPDPYVARDKILELNPDVITLDLEMPRMDGITFLRKLMRFRPLPVIVVSSHGQASSRLAIQALSEGAIDVLAKPAGPFSVGELQRELAGKIRAAALAARTGKLNVDRPSVTAPVPVTSSRSLSATRVELIAIGASTGGPGALEFLLQSLPADLPGILVVQHMPAGFSASFAERLDQVCPQQVLQAREGDEVLPGRVLIAPGDYHMVVRRSGGKLRVSLHQGPRVCFQRPSVDVLFSSVAETVGSGAIGIILTGMGSDGAEGMLRMKQAGARNIAQDESTSVVFGMPREAIQRGAVDKVLPLDQIPAAVVEWLEDSNSRPGAGNLNQLRYR